jgi:hypothetical protein
MAQPGRITQGKDAQALRAVSDFSHILAPSEATWVGQWDFFEGSCGHQYWIRMFGVRGWTVETSFPDPIEVELAGSQRSDGPIDMGIWIHGDTHDMNADEALMLAATLSQAAEELERIQGGRQ